MPICKKCGVDLPDGALFCLKCATPVAKASGSQQEEKSSEDYSDKTQIRDKHQKYGVVSFENIPVGYIISDRYVVQEKVGQGGFGAVYRCFDKKMDIDKALKIIPEAVLSDKETMFDLQQEARTMIALNHPNIVRVYDFHESGAIKFIDMEFLDGRNLSEIKLEFSDKKVPEARVREYALKIAEGMLYAHEGGDNVILHRDLKPHNVKLTSQGVIKIMDFGIAETVRTSMSRLEQGSSSGTLVYMSPEQLRGRDIGREADIYSFGALLYELLSGQPPFFRGDIQYQILNEQPKHIEHISPEMNSFLLKCLEKDYKNRYRNFGEIVEYWGGNVIISEKTAVVSPVKYADRKSGFPGVKKLVPVSISTTPENANIFVNGKEFTDDDEIGVGINKLKVSLEGYKTVDCDIEITETSSNRFHIDLEPIFGKLTVTSERAEMPIILNGSKTPFTTPHTFKDIISKKKYQIELESDDYYSDLVTITLNEKEEKTIAPELIKPSVLTVETTFRDIEFSVGGKKYKKTDPIQLKHGKHVLKPSHNYLPDLEVNIEKNRDLTVNYDEIVPKRKLLIEAGKYEINAAYQYYDDSLLIPLKPNEQMELLSGAGTVTIESGVFSKKYIYVTDNGSEIKIDFLKKIDRRKKKKVLDIFESFNRQEKAWKKAQEMDSTESYKDYLANYPEGKYAKIASNTMHEKNWEKAQEMDTLQSYGDYLAKYPKGRYTKIASYARHDKAWKIAKEIDTLKSYGDYLANYPTSRYADEIFKKFPISENMVLVEGGIFKMGRTQSDGYDDELPVHNISLNSFYIGKYLVTQSEYAAVTNSNPANGSRVGGSYPVYNVSWYDAIKFCNLLSMKEGLTPVYSVNGSTNPANWGSVPTSSNSTWNAAVCNWKANGYRLPTEAEWEYAARGGTNNPDYIYSGSDDIKKVAWYDGNNSPHGAKPVGGKAPNGLGIYDMSGNLWEWCWDWYGSYSSSPSNNPTGPSSGSGRLLRGGCWYDDADYCRVADRLSSDPDGSGSDVGFRLCRTFP